MLFCFLFVFVLTRLNDHYNGSNILFLGHSGGNQNSSSHLCVEETKEEEKEEKEEIRKISCGPRYYVAFSIIPKFQIPQPCHNPSHLDPLITVICNHPITYYDELQFTLYYKK